MNWPNHTDYQDAIQNPASCFQDDELRAATVVNDFLGMPKVMSGNFASVYELITANQKHYAIRCFVRPVTNHQVRYNLLTRHLQSVSLDCLVGFEFILKGIKLRNEWYPIVKMDWVTGVPMHIYIEEHVKEPETMLRLAQQWRQMMKGLRDNKIAHGDLQHGNVMCLPDGQFRLVDYDGMYVPAFGQTRSPELGHANYQHPRRTPDYYELAIDNFAALVIYTSFLALAREPELWAKFHTGDNLILQASDFKDPHNSPALQCLKRSPDEQVQKLATVIERACIWPIAQVPDFEDALNSLASGNLPGPAPVAPAAETIPDWLKSAEIEPAPSRPVQKPPASVQTAPRPGSRPALPKEVTPTKPSTRPAVEPTKTRPAPTTPAPVPATPTEEPSPFNYFAWASVVIAVISFIPKLSWFGLLAVICGVLGWLQAQKLARDPLGSKWASLGGMMAGGATFIIGLIQLLKKG